MNVAVTDVPRGKADTFGGLLRNGESPEQALKRLEKRKDYSKVIGTDAGQQLLAAATAQVAAAPNGGLSAKPRRRALTEIPAEPVLACDGSNHIPGCDHFPTTSAAAPEPTPDRSAPRGVQAPVERATPGSAPAAGRSSELLETVTAIALIPIDLIDVGENVRKDVGDIEGLAASIGELGLQQPVTVTPTAKGRYTLLLGQRRYLASRLLDEAQRQANGATRAPAVIRAIVVADPTEVLAKPGARRASEQVAENRVRMAMNPVEEALALRAILDADKKLSHAALAKRIGMSEPWIASTLAVLRAPAKVQDLVRSGELSLAHAKAIGGLDAETQVRLAKSAVANGISAHSLEESAKWERRTQGERNAGAKRTADAVKRALAALEQSGTPKDAVLFVYAEHWQIQDSEIRKALRDAGYTGVSDGWARGGEPWSKCDCASLQLRVRDGEGSTITRVCTNDTHWRVLEKEQNAARSEKEAAAKAERGELRTAVRAALPDDLQPTLARLMLKALDGYYGKAWTEYEKLQDKTVLNQLADKLTDDGVLRGSQFNGDSKRVPVKAILKGLSAAAAPAAPAEALPSGRKPGRPKADPA